MGCGAIAFLALSGFFIGKLQDCLIDQNRQLDLANQDLNQLVRLHAESQEKYRQAIDAILFMEIETAQILDANAVELTGYIRPELCRCKIWELYAPGDCQEMQALFERTRATGEATRDDLTVVYADGKRIDIKISVSVIEYNRAKVIQQIWREVTERKNFERQLRHAGKLASIGRLASGIAHEVW